MDLIGKARQMAVNKNKKHYSGGEPDFEEGDVFKLTVPLERAKNDKSVESAGFSERQIRIIDMIERDRTITLEDIALEIGVSKKTVSREIQDMKKICDISYDKKQKQWILV